MWGPVEPWRSGRVHTSTGWAAFVPGGHLRLLGTFSCCFAAHAAGGYCPSTVLSFAEISGGCLLRRQTLY